MDTDFVNREAEYMMTWMLIKSLYTNSFPTPVLCWGQVVCPDQIYTTVLCLHISHEAQSRHEIMWSVVRYILYQSTIPFPRSTCKLNPADIQYCAAFGWCGFARRILLRNCESSAKIPREIYSNLPFQNRHWACFIHSGGRIQASIEFRTFDLGEGRLLNRNTEAMDQFVNTRLCHSGLKL